MGPPPTPKGPLEAMPVVIVFAALVLIFCGRADAQTVKQINGDYVYHVSKTDKKCRQLRAAYYPAFQEIDQVLESSQSALSKLQQIQSIEKRLPTRIEISDTMIRSRFIRPVPELNIRALPTAANASATSWLSLYDALPSLSKDPVNVSPFFKILYDVKEAYFLNNLRAPRKGFYPWTIIYDCDTVLEIGSPTAPAGKRILFFQSDMDIDADGSDGKRHQDPRSYSKDGAFQPETSYRWKENPKVPNPFLNKWQAKMKNSEESIRLLEAQLAKWQSMQSTYGHQIEEDIASVKQRIATERATRYLAENRIRDVSGMRHLVGELDPFIVVPLSFTNDLPIKYKNHPFKPAVGDYAMVFYGNKIYPTIVGDQGPKRKCGEASLALAKQIRNDNDRLRSRKLSAVNSPFWDLEVSYLIFPGTAKDPATWGEPDLKRWHRECLAILDGLGGLAPGFSLHEW